MDYKNYIKRAMLKRRYSLKNRTDRIALRKLWKYEFEHPTPFDMLIRAALSDELEFDITDEEVEEYIRNMSPEEKEAYDRADKKIREHFGLD